MSKVKQQLDDASEFAKKNRTPQEAREEYVEKKERSVITDEQNEGVVYSSEQKLRNLAVKQGVADAYSKRCEMIKQFGEQVQGWRHQFGKEDGGADSLHIFHRDFLIKKEDEANAETVSQETHLVTKPTLVKERKVANEGDTQQLLVEAPSILYKPSEDKRGKGRGIYLDRIHPLNQRLLSDEEITDTLLTPFKVLGASDIFVMLRQEMDEADQEIDTVRKAIADLEDSKKGAIAKEDLEEAEKITFEQLAHHTLALEKHRKKLQTIFASNADVETFQENYETTKDGLENKLSEHTERVKADLEQLSQDIETAKKAQSNKYQEMLQAEEAHDQWLKGSNEKIKKSVSKHEALWEQICQLFEEFNTVSSELETEVNNQVVKVEEEANRKAEEDFFVTGLESYLDEMEAGRTSLESSLSWLDQLKTFTAKTADEVEKKKVAEEAVDIRINAQLLYLEDYRVFKQSCDDMLETMSSRTASLGRLKRSLEFQVKESLATLDPNTKKYRAELHEIEDQLRETSEKITVLGDQSKKEATLWQPTEEQLEDAQVDFTPPDIEADKIRCELKSKNISTNRAFVSGEQEIVDKATMELRRFKTSNQIAVEGAAKRRQEKIEQIEAAAEQPPQQPQSTTNPNETGGAVEPSPTS